MKKLSGVGIALCVWLSISYGIGLQHGLFRSQSTQGEQWMGTAEIVSEHFDVTVFPDYLDVELEWIFEVGGKEPENYADALEIVGNINFEDNSTVVSMLVWYQDMILKAKLKENKTARSEYEEVVERDAEAPPPPRDPVLLEMVRDDNYDISIFPIEFGGQRKVRIRYLIPGRTIEGEMRIGYPHAFTENASVAIKKGPGVAAYRLVTSQVIQPIFYNDEFEVLPAADYCFKPYGPSEGISITSIVPELTEEVIGSRMYVGDFSTETFAGTMAHISTPGGNEIMLKTTAEEDFVVIWRWNSANILRLYTQQIKMQAETLIRFFNALNASSKRGALIISKMGGESQMFALDRSGGEVFNDMIAYLTELTELVDPPIDNITRSSITAEETRALAEQSFEEFKAALQAAVDMMEESEGGKYILILTAGPYTRTSYDIGTDVPETDGITVSRFSQFYSVSGGGSISWPGVSLKSIIAPIEQSTFKIFAYITNGTQVDSFQTNMTSYYGGSACDRFVYSAQPLEQELTWKIFNNDELVAQFTEPLAVLPVDNAMQYARLVGAQKSMMPLAVTMPTSLASTLGFIDMKYTLLALEEDALPSEIAAQYENAGVPLLTTADIFPADDEQASIPVADWLKANPRETLENNMWHIMVMDDFRDFDGVPEVLVNEGGGAQQWGNPQAEVIAPQTQDVVADAFEIAPVVKEPGPITKQRISLQRQQEYLTIDFGTIASAIPRGAELVLYDINGRVVMRVRLDRILATGMMKARLKLSGVHSGMYLIRLEKGTISFSQSIMIR